jgi:hypothetical protein
VGNLWKRVADLLGVSRQDIDYYGIIENPAEAMLKDVSDKRSRIFKKVSAQFPRKRCPTHRVEVL